MKDQDITERIIAMAIKIHSRFGPGLLETAYRKMLFSLLVNDGWIVEEEKNLSIQFDGILIEQGYRIDLLVDNKVVVEVKSVEDLRRVHYNQIMTYLRVGNYRTGLLINFNVLSLKHGLRRVSNDRMLENKNKI
ncbi:GxxExxY protein [Chryseolinea sp. T2]|uniref:GxxExxY protein n=1 Tax=Chryseolinea sp. T2 TaxID=3129255 RepID=UPI003077C55A